MTADQSMSLGEMLTFDPLGTAERITGSSIHDDGSPAIGLGLALSIQHNARKEAALYAAGDTTFSDGLDRYLGIIEANGFERVLALPFMGHDTQETLYVYASRDGLLLRFDTHQGDRVNGGSVYYNWKPSDIATMHRHTSSGGFVTDEVWAGDHDAREALIFKMNTLRANGELVSPWVKRPSLWLLHYMDSKAEGYDYKAINEARISTLPQWVRDFIA